MASCMALTKLRCIPQRDNLYISREFLGEVFAFLLHMFISEAMRSMLTACLRTKS